MRHHTIFEWERRRFDGPEAIPVHAAERLVRVGKAVSGRLPGRPEVFDFGRDALSARQVVGIVQTASVSCEILPKVDREADPATAPELRRRLVHMLGVAFDLPVADGAAASLETQGETLLEILIGLFARTLGDTVRGGMPRRYVDHEEDLPARRGRLDVHRQFTALVTVPGRLACRFDALSPDIMINRIMKAAVTRLTSLARSAVNQRLLRELALAYADITTTPVRELDWTLVIDRSNARWRRLLALAELLLRGQHQTTGHGAEQGFALLFEMNDLFERYVARLLRGAAAPHGLEVVAQGGRRPCLRPEQGGGLFHTYPDIQLHGREGISMVLDTKWKRLSPAGGADAKQGVSQADVYQMMAYARLYGCPELVLLYPHHGGLGEEPVTSRFDMLPLGEQRLTVASLDMSSKSASLAGLARLMGLDPRGEGSLTRAEGHHGPTRSVT